MEERRNRRKDDGTGKIDGKLIILLVLLLLMQL